MKLIERAIKLMHKKESEEWDDIMFIVRNKVLPPDRKGHQSTKIWFWGLKRWGKIWPTMEYDLREK